MASRPQESGLSRLEPNNINAEIGKPFIYSIDYLVLIAKAYSKGAPRHECRHTSDHARDVSGPATESSSGAIIQSSDRQRDALCR